MNWSKCTDGLPSPSDECLLYFPRAMSFTSTWFCKYDEDGKRVWKASNGIGGRNVYDPPRPDCPTHYCIIELPIKELQ